MRHRRSTGPLALAFLIASSAGCDVYHRDVLDRIDAGRDAGFDTADSGAVDASLDARPDAGPSCVPRHPPARPSVADGDGAEIAFALRDVVLDQREGRWEELSVDLDDACTSGPETSTCVPREGGGVREDGAGGVDNVVGRELLNAFAEGNPELQEEARRDQERGEAAVVLYLSGWNGADDDPAVRVYLAQSVYAVPEGGARGDPLAWDGTDAFFVSELDFLDGDPDAPLVVDDFAYVAERVLVMRIPDGRSAYFPWSGNRMQLTLTDGIVMGRIDPTGTRIDDVTIAGRWSLLDLGLAMTSMGVCPGTTERIAADRLVETAADVRSDESTDGLGATCDALSVAVRLTGIRAELGGVVPVETLPPPCP